MRRLATAFVGALLLSCAPTKPITAWYYSAWIPKAGGGTEGMFDAARTSCLDQAGIEDPAGVAPDSPAESRFLICMNAAGWCTDVYGCRKPDAT